MKQYIGVCVFLLSACQSLEIPSAYVYSEIETSTFKLAGWQKITDPKAPYKIYIEGDGYAFRASGVVSSNPTPRGTLLRELAFGDSHPNVVYLARPCQFVEDNLCRPEYWSTARFSPEVIKATAEAVGQIAGQHKITLVGFSGGAQVAGLVAVQYPQLNIQKLVTVAGNLDVLSWVAYHQIRPLDKSEDLHDYRSSYLRIPQIHYVGEKDKNIVPEITYRFIGDSQNIILIKNASHNSGWEAAYSRIRSE